MGQLGDRRARLRPHFARQLGGFASARALPCASRRLERRERSAQLLRPDKQRVISCTMGRLADLLERSRGEPSIDRIELLGDRADRAEADWTQLGSAEDAQVF